MVGEPESLHIREPLKARIERHDYDRLLMLSDGVFAIAITLLALDLRLPNHWDGTIDQLLGATGRPLVGYLFGFGLVGSFWFMHRRLFAEMSQVDKVIAALNMLLLGLVGLTPYVARMIAEGGPGRAIPFYLATVASVLGTISLIRFWGSVRPRLLHPGVDRRAWIVDSVLLAASAIALGAIGTWAMVQRHPVSSNAFLGIILLLAVGKQFARGRRKFQRSSTNRP
jgi:uncharacterized membrane protein